MRKLNSEKFDLNSKWENLGFDLDYEVAFVSFLQPFKKVNYVVLIYES